MTCSSTLLLSHLSQVHAITFICYLCLETFNTITLLVRDDLLTLKV